MACHRGQIVPSDDLFQDRTAVFFTHFPDTFTIGLTTVTADSPSQVLEIFWEFSDSLKKNFVAEPNDGGLKQRMDAVAPCGGPGVSSD